MTDLTVFEFKQKAVVSSRDVADVVGRPHKQLMRTISTMLQHLGKETGRRKFAPANFFIPTTYTDEQGKERPCFYCTKMGCELVANKMTGEKGTLFTAQYVIKINSMETELEKRRVLRQISKPTRRSLTDALRDSGEDERMHGHSYGTYTDLVYKAAFGKTARQLRAERKAPRKAVLKDFLTSEELPLYEKKEAAVTVLLDAGMRYGAIRDVLLKGGGNGGDNLRSV